MTKSQWQWQCQCSLCVLQQLYLVAHIDRHVATGCSWRSHGVQSALFTICIWCDVMRQDLLTLQTLLVLTCSFWDKCQISWKNSCRRTWKSHHTAHQEQKQPKSSEHSIIVKLSVQEQKHDGCPARARRQWSGQGVSVRPWEQKRVTKEIATYQSALQHMAELLLQWLQTQTSSCFFRFKSKLSLCWDHWTRDSEALRLEGMTLNDNDVFFHLVCSFNFNHPSCTCTKSMHS